MSDDLLNTTIDETLALRRRIVKHYETHFEDNLNDPKIANVLLKTLSDMDKAAIGHTRARSEERAANTDQEAMRLADSIIKQLGDGNNPFMKPSETPREKPKLSSETANSIDVPDHVLETGKSNETIDQFNQRIDGNST